MKLIARLKALFHRRASKQDRLDRLMEHYEKIIDIALDVERERGRLYLPGVRSAAVLATLSVVSANSLDDSNRTVDAAVDAIQEVLRAYEYDPANLSESQLLAAIWKAPVNA